MIGTKDLGRYDLHHAWSSEVTSPKRPYGIQDLPEEWEDKLKSKALDGAQLVTIPDVHLCGGAMVGIKDNDIILDTAYYGRLDLYQRNYPAWKQAKACYQNIEPKTIEIGFSMGGVWSHNYFHWVLDHLPKLQLLDDADVPLIMTASPPDFVWESLGCFNHSWDQIEFYPHYHVKNLMVATTRRTEGYLYPSAAHWLKAAFEGTVRYEWDRIYIDRTDAVSRRIVNNLDMKEMLKKFGVKAVRPERLVFEDQIDLFYGADVVIAPHGAGLANLAWCKNDTTIVEIVAPQYTNPCAWLAGDALLHNYNYFVGDPRGDEDIFVDTERLEALLGDIL